MLESVLVGYLFRRGSESDDEDAAATIEAQKQQLTEKQLLVDRSASLFQSDRERPTDQENERQK